MKTLNVNQQTSKSTFWKDEAGVEIPYNRTTDYERKSERVTAKLANMSIKLNSQLEAFKLYLKKEVVMLYDEFKKENGGIIGKGKGNATFYNFDRSTKVEVAISEAITFDENTIELAKAKLDEVLNDGLQGAKDFIKPIVMEAFTKTNGKLDTKGVLGLRKHTSRVKDVRYAEAMELIDKSIRRPSSKEYFRVWLKDEAGEYKVIKLNFSDI